MLDRAPGAIAVAGAFVLVFSVLYDWGYFWAIGDFTYFSFMSISDHVSAALDRLPILTLMLLAPFLLQDIRFAANKQGKDEAALPILTIRGRMFVLSAWSKSKFIALIVGTAFCIVVGLRELFAVFAFLLFQELVFRGFAWLEPNVRSAELRATIVLVTLLLFLSSFPWFFGAMRGFADYWSAEANSAYEIKVEGVEEPLIATPLRPVSQGLVLYYSEENIIALVPWAKVSRVEHRQQYRPPLWCRITGLCFTPKDFGKPTPTHER